MHTVHQMQIHLKTQMCNSFHDLHLTTFPHMMIISPLYENAPHMKPGALTVQGHGENDHSCEVMTSFWDLWPS